MINHSLKEEISSFNVLIILDLEEDEYHFNPPSRISSSVLLYKPLLIFTSLPGSQSNSLWLTVSFSPLDDSFAFGS